jgi:hypothetical protein
VLLSKKNYLFGHLSKNIYFCILFRK